MRRRIWGIVAFSCYLQRPTAGPLLVIGILIGIMPWICIRLWMLGFGLFLVTAARIVFVHRAALGSVVRDLLLLGGPVLVSLAAFAAFDMYFFSTPMPNAGYLAIALCYFGFMSLSHGWTGLIVLQLGISLPRPFNACLRRRWPSIISASVSFPSSWQFGAE